MPAEEEQRGRAGGGAPEPQTAGSLRTATRAPTAAPPRSPPASAPQETRDSVVTNNQIKTALRPDRIHGPNRLKQPRRSLVTPRFISLGFFGLYLKIASYKYIRYILKRLYKHFFKKVVDHIAKDETFKNDGADTARGCHGASVTNLPRGQGQLGQGQLSRREGSAA